MARKLGQGHGDGHPLMPQHGAEPSLSRRRATPQDSGRPLGSAMKNGQLRNKRQRATCLSLVVVVVVVCVWWCGRDTNDAMFFHNAAALCAMVRGLGKGHSPQPPQPPQASDSSVPTFLLCVTCERMDLSVQPVSGAAQRRRERRLRSMLRHERMTVAMALAEFSHHSSRLKGTEDGQSRGVGARAELHGEDPEAPHIPAGALQSRRRARRGLANTSV